MQDDRPSQTAKISSSYQLDHLPKIIPAELWSSQLSLWLVNTPSQKMGVGKLTGFSAKCAVNDMWYVVYGI